MSGIFPRVWKWLACERNRGRVTVIAAVVGVLIAATTVVVSLQTPANEVRMSVSGFQDALERRAEEVQKDLAASHGEARIRLENERAEISRQLADVQAAYIERQERIGELETSLARLTTHLDDRGFAGARSALEAGDFSKADALLAAIEADTRMAVDHAADAAFQRGQIAALRFRWAQAADYFDKAARLNPTYDHLNQAGTFAWRSGRYATAFHHLSDLLDLSRREYGVGSLKTGTALGKFANLLSDMGRYEEAEPLYREALQIARETFGEMHPDHAARINNLANLLTDTGRYDEAEPLYRKALRIGKQTLGERHPDYATRINNLANLLVIVGRFQEAEPLYRQALQIGRQTVGRRHPDYATRLCNFATLLADTGRLHDAEPLFRQALDTGGRTLGDTHPNHATCLNNLAAALKQAGRYQEAEPLYRRALEVNRQTLGDRHPDYAVRLNNLASLLVTVGRHEEAEPLYRQALEVFRATLGDAHPTTRSTAKNYEQLLRASFPESRAVAQLRAAFGEDIGVP